MLSVAAPPAPHRPAIAPAAQPQPASPERSLPSAPVAKGLASTIAANLAEAIGSLMRLQPGETPDDHRLHSIRSTALRSC